MHNTIQKYMNDELHQLTGDIKRSPENVFRAEKLSLNLVILWMEENGYTEIPVQDDSNTISCARLEEEDEDLDHAIAWLPRDVFENSTPKGGWNPVVRIETLRAALLKLN